MGAVTTELVRWVWVAQKPLMGPLWRRAPRSAQPGPPFAHTVPVCSLGCHAVCVLCRQILRGQAAAAPIVSRIAQSMARRRAARARARRAAAAAGGATTGPKVRRGSWHPKQRATAFENSLEKYKRWRYDRLAFFLSQRHRCQRWSAELNPRRWLRQEFPEILSEIRGSAAFLLSRNFPGNKGVRKGLCDPKSEFPSSRGAARKSLTRLH